MDLFEDDDLFLDLLLHQLLDLGLKLFGLMFQLMDLSL